MAATVTFTDTVGSATLTALGGRLNNWTPDPLPIDDAATRLGSGQVDTFEFRETGKVTFSLLVVNSDMSVALRLMRHLWRGASCTVNTGDLSSPSSLSYADMAIGTDSDGHRIAPTLVRQDRETLDYELTVTLQYIGTGTVPLPIVLY